MKRALRVLLVIPGDARGSSMIFARRQAESVAREGAEVRSFYLASRTSPWILAQEFLRLREELARFDPAVVHAQYGTVTGLFAALAAGRRPCVITFRGSDLNPSRGGLRSALARLFSQLAAWRAARIVCVSRELRDRLWFRRSRVTVLPTGVDCLRFRPEPRESAREFLRWEGRVILFNAGYERRNKRQDLAEGALELARRTLPDLRLEVLNGDVDPALVPRLMNGSDCLLVTSEREGSPTVVQEALACGLPVVSVDVGDVAERLAGTANTALVSRDEPAIAEALIKLTAVPLRSDGPAHASSFSSQNVARELCRLYREASGA